MKKTVKYNGENIKVEFEYNHTKTIDLVEDYNNSNVGDLVRLVTYDYIINGVVFKAVNECTFIGKHKKYPISSVVTFPEYFDIDFKENHKQIIETIINKYPNII